MTLRELFEAALALAPAEREAFLDAQCPDAAMRAQLDAMLRADAAAGEPVSHRKLAELADALGDEPVPPPTSGQIGPFEIVRVIGEGGASTVFEARRTLEGAVQPVALKLLRHSLLSPDARRRFGREQRALIRLQHPNIARMIDAGVSDSGQAYIALELIDGMPVTDHAHNRALGMRERLLLALTVCRAVQAAHQALIVHRDLKPSNVLVTAAGEVKLLDFGIAKLLVDEMDTDTTMLPAFTPAYAAPEQISGGATTTATDVYALGIVLRELFTGARDAGKATPQELVAGKLHEPGKLTTRRRLRGDLEAVVGKATEADPDKRYGSAGALADEIERLLDGRPVKAQPPTRWYRMRKFITRHKGGVATTCAFLLAVLAALGVALWQAQLARRAAARANTVRAFVEGLFQPISDGLAAGRQPSLRELVDRGAQRVAEGEALGATERVDLLLMFSRLYDYLNEPARMQELADQAGTLADEALGQRDPLAIDAIVARGIAALRRNDPAAMQLLTDAERRLAAAGDRGDAWIRVHDGLAAISNQRGDAAQTLAHERSALDARIARYGPDSKEAAGGYGNLGFALSGSGQFSEAALSFRHAYAGLSASVGARSARAALTLASLGDVEMMAGELALARDHLREALAVLDEVDAGAKPSANHLAAVQYHCHVEFTTGSQRAQAVCADAVELARKGGSEMTLGRVQRLAGLERLQAGELAAARALFDDSAQRLAKAPASWQARTAIARGELALVDGDARAAAALLARGVEQQGQAYPRYLHGYGLALLALACTQAPGAAECVGHDGAAIARKALEDDAYRWTPLLLPAHVALARVDLLAGHPAQAAQRLRSAIEHAGAPIAPAQAHLVAARLWLAVATAQAGSCEHARSQAREALDLSARPASDPNPLHAPAIAAARNAGTCGDLLANAR